MPYIIKNGIAYAGNAVTVTQAQYDALSEAEKKNGTVYYIYDSDAVLDASDVGLGSGTVEDLAGSVAVIETSPTTATHAVGSYLVYNGQLYKVTSAISAGATLTPNTNIKATTAGAELTSLNNSLTNMVKSVSGTTPSTSSELVLAYPTGFTMNNCSIVNVEIYFNGIWRNLSAMAESPSYQVITSLRANGIYVYPTGNSAMNTAIRITLLRIA